MIYFDHNATTPLSPVARDAWLEASEESWQNPSSPYRSAARVRNRLEAARERVAAVIGAGEPWEVFFNSGATEGNNSLFSYFSRKAGASHTRKGRASGAPVLLSFVEHPSVREAAQFYFPGRVAYVPVTADGRVDPAAFERKVKAISPLLVSIMAVNNETGVVQPWRQILKICRSRGIPYHCDASQWVGKLPCEELGECDFLTASAHKFGGPKGVGFMRVSPQWDDFHGLVGGGQEEGRRGGTENYPSVAAMTTALEEIEERGFAELPQREEQRKEFETAVKEGLPGARVIAEDEERLWNTVSLFLPGHENHRWVTRLDREGFAVSTGSACATGSKKPSHVLDAMGFSAGDVRHVIRVSGGWETDESDWSGLARAIVEIGKRGDSDGDTSLTEVISI
ncbi:MAG: cysteine desulfurase family protein [Opitutales bacterium]